MSEVKWMSRDVDSMSVEFWTEEPVLGLRQEGIWGHGRNDDSSMASLDVSLVPNAPKAGKHLPITDLKTFTFTVAKLWLYRNEQNGMYQVYEGASLSDGRIVDTVRAAIAKLIHPNHNLQPGQCCEIPRRVS